MDTRQIFTMVDLYCICARMQFFLIFSIPQVLVIEWCMFQNTAFSVTHV